MGNPCVINAKEGIVPVIEAQGNTVVFSVFTVLHCPSLTICLYQDSYHNRWSVKDSECLNYVLGRETVTVSISTLNINILADINIFASRISN